MTEFIDPSNKYSLFVEKFLVKEGRWEYNKIIIKDLQKDIILFDLQRNYPTFWHCWVIDHPNGNDYLLLGENYQGYNMINLTKQINHQHKNPNNFCWRNVHISPDKTKLMVEGCIFSCSDELHVYDFNNPDILPFKKIFEDCGILCWHDLELEWENNNKIKIKISISDNMCGEEFNDFTYPPKDEYNDIIDTLIENGYYIEKINDKLHIAEITIS